MYLHKISILNPEHGRVYNFFLRTPELFKTNKTDCHDITEIVLKGVLNLS
jgi:hypothetical protein